MRLGKNVNTGAKRARELRAELGLPDDEPPGCLVELVEERLGLAVNVAALPEGVEGVCLRHRDDVTMLWVKAHEFVPRSRFTLAHELGHVRCGHDGATIVETFKTIDGKDTSSPEVQANAFAGELLAPKPAVLAMLDGREPTLEDVVEIAARFGVSMTVARIRLSTTGALRDTQPLRDRIEAGEHLPLWEAHGEVRHDDLLGTLDRDRLPRLSPRLGDSGLSALLRGDASIEETAASAGCDPAELADGLTLLGV